jgi:F-type H+-transporting ATPase subunit b
MKAGLVEISWTLLFQIINTIILFLALKHFLFKPIRNFMKSRQDSITESIQDAEDKNNEALELKSQYEGKLAQAEDEGRQLVKEAAKRAEVRADEIIRDAQVKAEKILQKAEEEIERQNAKAVNVLKDEIASLAVMVAGKVINKSLDEEGHKELIQEFMNEVGEVKWHN